MKPEKYGLYEFYAQPLVGELYVLYQKFLISLGYWECAECNKIYSKRVKKYPMSYANGEEKRIGFISETQYVNLAVCSNCKPKEDESNGISDPSESDSGPRTGTL